MDERNVKFPVKRVIAVVENSPAWDLIIRSIPIEPGRIIPCTQEQFDSLQRDCLILDVLPPEESAGEGQ
jgi:hypothetical protein